MVKLKAFVLNNIANFILLAVVYSLLCTFFPLREIYYKFFDNDIVFNILSILTKVIFSIFPLIFFISIRIVYKKQKDIFSKIVLFVCFIIAVNNFPIFTVLEQFGYLSDNFGIWLNHVFSCFAIGLFEELIFRGIIYTLFVAEIFKAQKFKEIKSIIFSSLLFSLTHVINVFSGEEWYFVLLQTSYSFLTGCLFALSYFISGKLLVAIILHFIYNFGGLLQDNGVISGGLWSVTQTVETVILSIIFAIIILIYIYKKLVKEKL